ncbi:hypothetical protein B0H13DRAFT_2039447, partial [Mycena leptocephala]
MTKKGKGARIQVDLRSILKTQITDKPTSVENVDLIAASLSFLVSFSLLSTPLQTTQRYIVSVSLCQWTMLSHRNFSNVDIAPLSPDNTLPLSSGPPPHLTPSSLTSIPSLTAAVYAILLPSYTLHITVPTPRHAPSLCAILEYLRKLTNSRSSEDDLPILGGSACGGETGEMGEMGDSARGRTSRCGGGRKTPKTLFGIFATRALKLREEIVVG